MVGESDNPPLARGSSLFGNRNFLLLWAAYGISAMGDHISESALLKTQNAMASHNMTQLQALISFMFFIPFFVLGPFTGLLADRLPRRGIMIFADLCRAALMFNFALLIGWFSGRAGWSAFMPVLVVGIFAALFSPARSALLPTLVADDQLVRSNAMISGLGVIASMIAVLLGGWLADNRPAEYAFRVDAATFVASAVCLAFIRPPARERQRQAAEVSPAALLEALRYIRRHRRVAQLIVVAVVVWACGSIVRSSVPAIVRDVYGFATYMKTMSMLVFLAVGMLSGAVVLTALGDALRSEMAIAWSLMGIAFAIALLGVTVFCRLPGEVGYWLGGVAVLLSGLFAAGVMTSYSALLQRMVPNRLRGRVFGFIDLATIGGLLLATGALGLPEWTQIDRWVGYLLAAVTAIVLATGLAALLIRLGGSKIPPRQRFWMNVNEFYCKFWFRLRREGISTIPPAGPVIVVANHTCAIDPLLLIACSMNRPLGFLIAEEYSHVPLGNRLIRMMECIPVKREQVDAAATKAALRHLRAGKPLGIFIEGRIPRPGEYVEPKDGAALLALHTGATVVPAHISGTLYTESIAGAFLRRHRACVRFGKPIDLSAYRGPKPDKQTLHTISMLFLERIRELGAEPAGVAHPA